MEVLEAISLLEGFGFLSAHKGVATDVLRAIHANTLRLGCCKVESLSLSLPLSLGVGHLMLEQHHFSV